MTVAMRGHFTEANTAPKRKVALAAGVARDGKSANPAWCETTKRQRDKARKHEATDARSHRGTITEGQSHRGGETLGGEAIP